MTHILFTAALLLAMQGPAETTPPQPQVAPAELAKLTPASQIALRCSAAFALVSYGQEHGNDAALNWPNIDPRGREYFVRVMAQIMDQTGLDRDSVSRLASYEAQQLLDQGQIDAIMPQCLALLEQSGV